MIHRYLFGLFVFFCSLPLLHSANVPKDVSVPLIATVTNTGTLRVELKWPADKNSLGYTILRKQKDEASFNTMEELGGMDSMWIDTDILEGIGYEYAISKVLIKDTLNAYGFVAAGWKVAVDASHGHMLLLVDKTVHASLGTEVKRLAQDLWNEGWYVQIKEAPRAPTFDSAAVRATKDIVREWYNTLNGEPAYLFIIGRVPVPYSGMVYMGKSYPGPDGHGEHSGAWAADSYYSCMIDDNLWTDDITNTVGAYPDNKNFPNDGRFDNMFVPGSFDIKVGRVDLYNMGLFYHDSTGSGASRKVDSLASEIHLIRNYLDRNHAYRTNAFKLPWRGLIDDNFGGYGEQFARCAWMAYPALLGANSAVERDYITTLDTAGYLWSYGCGGGGSDFQSAGGVGTSTDISKKKLNTVFSMLFGSYFGDWDKANNLLRAPLAVSPGALTNCWAGRPYWYFQQMALGETIGTCYQISANNDNTYPSGIYPRGVHIALMGDPSLRMSYGTVGVAQNLSVKQVAAPTKGVQLSWSAPAGTEVVGYYVYKQNADAAVVPLNGGAMINETSFLDEQLTDGVVRYIVRTVGVLTSSSGSFNELSAPLEQSLTVSSVEDQSNASTQLRCYPNPAQNSCAVELNLQSSAAVSVSLYNSNGALIRRLESSWLSAGEQHLVWDLSDDAGNRVADGVYVLQVRIGAELLVKKLSIVH